MTAAPQYGHEIAELVPTGTATTARPSDAEVFASAGMQLSYMIIATAVHGGRRSEAGSVSESLYRGLGMFVALALLGIVDRKARDA